MTEKKQPDERPGATSKRLNDGNQNPDEADRGGPRIGFIPREELSNSEYHRGPGVSKSGLIAVGTRTPLHYITAKHNPKPTTPALMFGTIYHDLVLEPETFWGRYILQPQEAPKRPTALQVNPRKGEPKPEHLEAHEFWQDFDKKADGKIMISTDSNPEKGIWGRSDWDNLQYMRDTLLDPILHPNICLALAPHLMDWNSDQGDSGEDTLDELRWQTSGGPSELSAFVVDKRAPFSGAIQYDPTFKLMKCRLDKLNDANNVAVDLKTTIDASYSSFARSVAEFHYHVQDAMYMDIFRQLDRPLKGFLFVAQEKTPPYAPAIYELPQRAKQFGLDLYRRYLELYAKCHSDNEWPGYPQEIRHLELPPWAYRVDVV